MKSPDPVIVICLAVGAWVMYVMGTAMRDEPAVQDGLAVEAGLIQLQNAGRHQ